MFKLALCRITIIRYYLTEAWLHSCNAHTQWSNFNWSAVVGYAANQDSDHYLHVFIFLVCIHHQDIPLSKWPLPVKHKIPVLLVIYRLCLAMWEKKPLQIPKVYRASNIACFACYVLILWAENHTQMKTVYYTGFMQKKYIYKFFH